jgi:hypothetical protein
MSRHGWSRGASPPRSMQARQGALVIDMYSDLLTNLNGWISPLDCLDQTAAAYQEMARVLFNTIQATFELSPAATTVRAPGPSRTPPIAVRPSER